MYCSKCGTKVADDDYACYMCGSRLHNNVRSALDILREQEAEEAAVRAAELKQAWQNADRDGVVIADDPIEATVQEIFAGRASEFAAEDNEDLEYIHTLIGDRDEGRIKEKKNRALITAVIVIAVAALAVTGTYLILTRHSDKAGETEPVIPDMSIGGPVEKSAEDEPEEEIRVSMIGRARELRDGYLDEEVSYEEVMTQLDLLKDSVFDDIDEYNGIIEQIERINTSRLTFNKAERSFARGEYPDAVNEYREVLEEDEKYYERAQEGIVRCDDAVLELVRGRWSYEYDAHREVQQYVKEKGFDIDLSKMKIPIVFLFDLKDDCSIEVSVDYDALNEYIDKVLDLAVETMGKGASANLPGNLDVSSILKNMYSSSGIKDSIKEQLNIREALDNLLEEAGIDKIDSYRAQDGHLYIGTACMDAAFEEDVLTLTSQDSEALAVGHYRMPYPIRMKLVNKPDKKDQKSGEEKEETTDKESPEEKKETSDKKDTSDFKSREIKEETADQRSGEDKEETADQKSREEKTEKTEKTDQGD